MSTRLVCLIALVLAATACERTGPSNTIAPAPESSAKSAPSAVAPAAPTVTLEAIVASYDEPEEGEPKTTYEGKVVRVKGKLVERRADADAGWSILMLGLPGEEITLSCSFTPIETPPLALGSEVQLEGKLATRYKFSKKGGPAPDPYLADCRLVR